uniref:Uncharacterized protein n=1 Tax=Rangifer tarandus platyrhynchus TaxID=3082113 RepID=A0ACB0DS51_RANTA|nr:unnamed protein product [Rangifer tarandus platyrhynchus]
MRKVVLITGASSGVGLALCRRLLEEDDVLHLCLACRNMSKAEAVRTSLLASHPAAEVSILQVDVSSLPSVFQATKELKQRFQRLDYVYLNAGIMPNPQLNIKALFHGLFTRNVIHMFSTAEGLLTQNDKLTPDGLQEAFLEPSSSKAAEFHTGLPKYQHPFHCMLKEESHEGMLLGPVTLERNLEEHWCPIHCMLKEESHEGMPLGPVTLERNLEEHWCPIHCMLKEESHEGMPLGPVTLERNLEERWCPIHCMLKEESHEGMPLGPVTLERNLEERWCPIHCMLKEESHEGMLLGPVTLERNLEEHWP